MFNLHGRWDDVKSPDELNGYLRTFIVAPLTTGSHPFRDNAGLWIRGGAPDHRESPLPV
jgi:hypothetical protein